jgi:hypothetical protein
MSAAARKRIAARRLSISTLRSLYTIEWLVVPCSRRGNFCGTIHARRKFPMELRFGCLTGPWDAHSFFQSVRFASSSTISNNRWSRRSCSATAAAFFLPSPMRFASRISAISCLIDLTRSATGFCTKTEYQMVICAKWQTLFRHCLL